jgi:hypothetical protein
MFRTLARPRIDFAGDPPSNGRISSPSPFLFRARGIRDFALSYL